MARNPPWAEDELILAMDVYVRDGMLDDSDPRVIELSDVLDRLPIHTERPAEEKFRNPDGSVGEGFIECHHTRPLSDSGPTRTALKELALVCSNCHRMLHRARPWVSIVELRQRLRR